MDLETEVIEEKSIEKITAEKILKMKETFTGEIFQIPPMYSALKVKGKTLYNLARKGKTVERQPRKVTVSKFEIVNVDLPEIHFEISCSKGTYIRVIANDLGEKLGCGGVLSSLRRTQIGAFSVKKALKMEEFEERIAQGSLKTS
jgi:tRNA pseudouridine55 synthase